MQTKHGALREQMPGAVGRNGRDPGLGLLQRCRLPFPGVFAQHSPPIPCWSCLRS